MQLGAPRMIEQTFYDVDCARRATHARSRSSHAAMMRSNSTAIGVVRLLLLLLGAGLLIMVLLPAALAAQAASTA